MICNLTHAPPVLSVAEHLDSHLAELGVHSVQAHRRASTRPKVAGQAPDSQGRQGLVYEWTKPLNLDPDHCLLFVGN